MSKTSCCYNCESRYPNCHSECNDYLKEYEERRELNQLKRNKKAISRYCVEKKIRMDKIKNH